MDHDDRLDLHDIGSGDPGDGLPFATAFELGRVLRSAQAMWSQHANLMLAGTGALLGIDVVMAVALTIVNAFLQYAPMVTGGSSSADLAQIAVAVGLIAVGWIVHSVAREFVEAGFITSVAQVARGGSWSAGTLFFAVGPTVRRMLIQVLGTLALAVPGSLLAAVVAAVGWGTLGPMIQKGNYGNWEAWMGAGLATLGVAAVALVIYQLLWCVVWLLLQPGIVAATLDLNPFEAAVWSMRETMRALGPVLALNAVYAVVVVPLALMSSQGGVCGTAALVVAGIPLAMLRTTWFSGTALAWLSHARDPAEWPTEELKARLGSS